MLYAITIDSLNATFFVSDRPDDNEWEVQEDVSLEVGTIYGTWTPDLGPLHETLCVSISRPKYYRVFHHSKDICNKEYRPTGRHFGGLFPKDAWERFAEAAPPLLAALERGDDEPVCAQEEILAAIQQGT